MIKAFLKICKNFREQNKNIFIKNKKKIKMIKNLTIRKKIICFISYES